MKCYLCDFAVDPKDDFKAWMVKRGKLGAPLCVSCVARFKIEMYTRPAPSVDLDQWEPRQAVYYRNAG